jgi:GntR family transcriptional repressor for pyruvate dehydrogenase complex
MTLLGNYENVRLTSYLKGSGMAVSDVASARADRGRLSSMVADSLVGRIAEGSLRAGDALPSESELARQFAVSKPVVREALGHLAALGVVSIQQGKPTTIRAVGSGPLDDYFRIAVRANDDGLREAIELRRAIETEVAGLAAERMTAADLASLAVALRRMEEHVADLEPWLDADLAFHTALVHGARNSLLLHMLGALGEVMRYTMRLLHTQTDLRDPAATLRRHVAIFEAVHARDVDGARRAMAEHFQATQPVVRAILADRSRKQDGAR